MSTQDRVLILHGWGGSDYPHWQAHLAMEVAKHYGTVSFPLIQHPHYPSKKRWLKQLHNHMQRFAPTTVVCHSLANTLWFWYGMQEDALACKRLFLVSPPSLTTKLNTLSSFFPAPLPPKILANEVTMIVSTNDPYIDINEARTLNRSLGAKLITLENAGHINADSGFGKWELIERLVIHNKRRADDLSD